MALLLIIGELKMITCAHKDCGYQVGWPEIITDETERLEPPEGEFYQVGFANRFHGDKNDLYVMGCPKCKRTFLSDKDI